MIGVETATVAAVTSITWAILSNTWQTPTRAQDTSHSTTLILPGGSSLPTSPPGDWNNVEWNNSQNLTKYFFQTKSWKAPSLQIRYWVDWRWARLLHRGAGRNIRSGSAGVEVQLYLLAQCRTGYYARNLVSWHLLAACGLWTCWQNRSWAHQEIHWSQDGWLCVGRQDLDQKRSDGM